MSKSADTFASPVEGVKGRTSPSEQEGWDAPATSERWTMRLRALLGSREPSRVRCLPSPEAIEEEAASRLYGRRTGTVSASPASCPVDPNAVGVEPR